jgi:hypothetical protein
MGFERAALRERLGVEIEHDRAALERLAQVEAERLAAQRALRGEIGRAGALRQRGIGSRQRSEERAKAANAARGSA